MAYIYILKSKRKGSYYIGSTIDVEKRLVMHNDGRVKSTKRYAPWDLVYFEKYLNLKDAVMRERQIKSWKKRKAIEKLIGHFKIA